MASTLTAATRGQLQGAVAWCIRLYFQAGETRERRRATFRHDLIRNSYLGAKVRRALPAYRLLPRYRPVGPRDCRPTGAGSGCIATDNPPRVQHASGGLIGSSTGRSAGADDAGHRTRAVNRSFSRSHHPHMPRHSRRFFGDLARLKPSAAREAVDGETVKARPDLSAPAAVICALRGWYGCRDRPRRWAAVNFCQSPPSTRCSASAIKCQGGRRSGCRADRHGLDGMRAARKSSRPAEA